MTDEREAVSGGRGKWSQLGVPHRGWVCVDEYDTYERLGEDQLETCGMCEFSQVRFVHVMENERYPDQLHCGCVCAGNMEQDLASAERRDGTLRSRAGKRDAFPKRKRWKISAKGTPHIKVDGYHLLVVRRSDGKFGVGATPPGGEIIWGRKHYPSIEEAQKGCFDAWQVLAARCPR